MHSSPVRQLGARCIGVLSAPGLASILLILLGVLTWLGTLEQVENGLYEVQRKYFDSLVLFHDFGPFSLPLPGARLVLGVLFVNLSVGGLLRLRRGWSTLGILITHAGVAFLIVAAFIKATFSEEGHVTLFEGQRTEHFQSYVRWEIAVLEDLGEGRVREYIVAEEAFRDAGGGRSVRLTSRALPFALQVDRFEPNCRALAAGPRVQVDGPVVDGVFLQARPREPEAEANIAGADVVLVTRDARPVPGLLWGAESAPLGLELAGRRYAIELRKERYPLDFTLALEDFTKEDHPGIEMAKAFSSDVTVIDGGSERPVHISMNEPLRAKGLVLYQASFGPANARPGQALFSTLAVVRNPADRYPVIACILIAAGLIAHFSRKLVGHIRAEVRRP